ncbi:hypothetical protein EIQ28_13450 [Xanthomonas campestris pv. plantaginis]
MAWTALIASRGQSDPDSGVLDHDARHRRTAFVAEMGNRESGIGNREWGIGKGKSTAGDFDHQVGSAAQSGQRCMVVACAWCFKTMPTTNTSSTVLCIGGAAVPVASTNDDCLARGVRAPATRVHR